MAACCVLASAACTPGEPRAVPTIGSPTPTPSVTASTSGRAEQVARQWGLRGSPLPEDWPDVPLPRGTEVVTAYAVGDPPRRTWTATFLADEGVALDLARPVVEALAEQGYQPIAAYVGAPGTNTGLYSFSAPQWAVYVVLGEDNGRPNLVITVRSAAASPTPEASAIASPPGGDPPSATPRQP